MIRVYLTNGCQADVEGDAVESGPFITGAGSAHVPEAANVALLCKDTIDSRTTGRFRVSDVAGYCITSGRIEARDGQADGPVIIAEEEYVSEQE